MTTKLIRLKFQHKEGEDDGNRLNVYLARAGMGIRSSDVILGEMYSREYSAGLRGWIYRWRLLSPTGVWVNIDLFDGEFEEVGL